MFHRARKDGHGVVKGQSTAERCAAYRRRITACWQAAGPEERQLYKDKIGVEGGYVHLEGARAARYRDTAAAALRPTLTLVDAVGGVMFFPREGARNSSIGQLGLSSVRACHVLLW